MGDAKGFWVGAYWPADVLTPFSTNRNIPAGACPRYARYKTLSLQDGDPDKAWRVVCWVKEQPYHVTGIPRGRNCMDDAFDILVAYGAGFLPWPTTHPAPNFWFDSIQAPAMQLPLKMPLKLAVGKSKRKLTLPKVERTEIPPWRAEGTEEYRRFNSP
jgi:hypothetical protein